MSRGSKTKQRKQRRSPRKEYLTEVEILPSEAINLNTPYLLIKSGITGARASAMAKLFGEYRIKSVTYTYRPIFDTYSSSLPGTGNSPNSIPTLYWRMNRYGDAPAAFDGDYMRAMGAKPHRLDDKQVSYTYKPNIILSQQNNANVTTATIKVSPWLSTDDFVDDNNFNLSTADHFGNVLFVEGGGAGTALGAVALLDTKVVYEFRNPRLTAVPAVTKDPVTGMEKPTPQVVKIKA